MKKRNKSKVRTRGRYAGEWEMSLCYEFEKWTMITFVLSFGYFSDGTYHVDVVEKLNWYFNFAIYLLPAGINSLSTNSWNAGSNHFSISILLCHISFILPCWKALFIHRNHPVHSLSLKTFRWRRWKTCANVYRIW